MFAEYRELIARLRAEGKQSHFLALYDKHEELDKKIAADTRHGTGVAAAQIDALKREKLRLKDEIYAFLRQYDGASVK